MEYLRKISNLTSFLYPANPSLDSISRFLVLDTFSEFAPTAIILGLLHSDGSMVISGSFGINQDIQNEVLRLASGLDNPFSQAMRKDRIIEFDGIEVLSTSRRHGKEKEVFFVGFEYSLAWPIHYVGAAILCFAKKPMLKPIDELFFHAIGGMLALHHAHLTTLSMLEDATSLAGLRRNQHSDSSMNQSVELTARQLIILAALRRGDKNSTIATELNFSESLIRQETVEIYSKMGVSGRKELLQSDDLGENHTL